MPAAQHGPARPCGSPEEARGLLETVKPHIDRDERIATLRAALTFAQSTESGFGEAELKTTISDIPSDLEARLALANLLAGPKRYQEALDQLLEIVRRDKTWRDGQARKQILAIFKLADDQQKLVSEYRRALASVLH